MQWWAWLVIGALLFGAEMFFIDAQFFLVFFGIAAAVVGVMELLGVDLAPWVQWLAFAALSIVAMLAFRKRLYEKLRKPMDAVQEPFALGDRVTLPARLEPGQSCRVEYRGSTWTARNVDSVALAAGEVEIVFIDGLTLHVRQPR